MPSVTLARPQRPLGAASSGGDLRGRAGWGRIQEQAVVRTKAVGFGFCARVSGRDKAEVPR